MIPWDHASLAHGAKSTSGLSAYALRPLVLIIWYVTINSTTVAIKRHAIHIIRPPWYLATGDRPASLGISPDGQTIGAEDRCWARSCVARDGLMLAQDSVAKDQVTQCIG